MILDNLIMVEGLSDYITTLNTKVNEELEWQYYLHRIFDKSFKDWKDEADDYTQESSVSLEATLNNSKDILSNFDPQDGG